MRFYLICLAAVLSAGTLAGQTATAKATSYLLDSSAGLEAINVRVEPVTYRDRRGVRLVGDDAETTLAILTDSDFREGTVEVTVAGRVLPGAPEGSRGFIGLAFHVEPAGSRFQTFYLRPTNGRTSDQLRRNHSVQYTSEPDFPWHRLRKEFPGVYESYADIEPDVWTRMKIVVTRDRAELFVNGAPQPCLVVTDFKASATGRKIALWVGQGTEGYFTDLTVRMTPEPGPNAARLDR